jgi:hypothetical protein
MRNFLFILQTALSLSFSSILGVPWFEMGGKVSIECEKTGYSASIEFLTKVSFSTSY